VFLLYYVFNKAGIERLERLIRKLVLEQKAVLKRMRNRIAHVWTRVRNS